MRPLLPVAAGIGFVTALGCGGLVPDLSNIESVPPPSEEWVGTWMWNDESQTITLDIDPDGGVRYHKQGQSSNVDIAGPATSWEGTLKCCFGFQDFTIDAAPALDDDGAWTMTLDGRIYVREPRELPPPDEL